MTRGGIKVGNVCAGTLEYSIAVVSYFWCELGSISEAFIRKLCILFVCSPIGSFSIDKSIGGFLKVSDISLRTNGVSQE